MEKMNKEIIIDSGFFIALLNKNDQYHNKANQVVRSLPQRRWVSTWLVITEVTYMLMKRQAFAAIQGLLDLCEHGGVRLFHLETRHIPRLKQVMQKYQALPADLADASLIILAEELGQGDILSTDLRDFTTYHWKNHKPFSNFFPYV